jgi:hypothetical protein
MIKKKYWLFLFCIGFILKIANNATVFSWKKNSESIVLSKNNDLFLGEYRIQLINNLTPLSDSDVLDLLNKCVSWSEYEWHNSPYLVFFHPIQKKENKIIIIKHKNFTIDYSLTEKHWFSIKLKGSGMSRKVRNRDNNLVCHVLDVGKEHLPKEIDVVFYENNNLVFFEVRLTKKE